jgi:predicted P-loop ATPase
MIALSTNFIVNMDELATLSRTELNSLKSLISKDRINVRLPFARKATVMPRRANFIGSTNKDEFLSDETGSVRWLCFTLNGQMDFAYKNDVNVDDIWRQAYTLYKEGYEFELTPEDIAENEKANETFQMTSIEAQLIQKFFAPPNSDGEQTFYTPADICLKLSILAPNIKANMHNVGRAMKRLGYEKTNKYSDEKRFSVKGYNIKLLDT